MTTTIGSLPEVKQKLEHLKNTMPKHARMVYEKPKHNAKQQLMYRQCLFGLSLYSKEDIRSMASRKRKKIRDRHMRTQIALNELKQRRVHDISNVLLGTLFPNSRLVSDLITEPFEADKTMNRMSMKDLKISKDNIIEHLLKKGILPQQFLNLE